MLNRSASLAVSTSILEALPGKLDISRHSPSILSLYCVWVKTDLKVYVIFVVSLLLLAYFVYASTDQDPR